MVLAIINIIRATLKMMVVMMMGNKNSGEVRKESGVQEQSPGEGPWVERSPQKPTMTFRKMMVEIYA